MFRVSSFWFCRRGGACGGFFLFLVSGFLFLVLLSGLSVSHEIHEMWVGGFLTQSGIGGVSRECLVTSGFFFF